MASPKILEVLVQAGAMIAEVDDDGWDCLFKCVEGSYIPWYSSEFKALRFLLTPFEDIFARDTYGRSILDVVAEYQSSPVTGRVSYRQDLW